MTTPFFGSRGVGSIWSSGFFRAEAGMAAVVAGLPDFFSLFFVSTAAKAGDSASASTRAVREERRSWVVMKKKQQRGRVSGSCHRILYTIASRNGRKGRKGCKSRPLRSLREAIKSKAFHPE